MTASERGLRLIKNFEGLRLNAYLCPSKVWTIGYGHTGPEVVQGLVITQEQADALLKKDLARFEAAVTKAVKVPLTQNQFDALVSFVFNIGSGAFRTSTLLRLLNAGDYAGAAGQFERWVRGSGGVKLAGLVRRRKAEALLFRGDG